MPEYRISEETLQTAITYIETQPIKDALGLYQRLLQTSRQPLTPPPGPPATQIIAEAQDNEQKKPNPKKK